MLVYRFIAAFIACSAICCADPPNPFEQSSPRPPLQFIQNQGQLPEEVAYYVQGAERSIFFTDEGLTISLKGIQGKRWSVKLDFLNSDPRATLTAGEKQEAVFSYFTGKPQDWKAGIPTFRKLVYGDLWPGIDLVYSGTVDQLKYEFVVQPGADPRAIRLAYRGADRVLISDSGVLEISTPAGCFTDGKPYAYQRIEGQEQAVSMRYQLQSGPGAESCAYGFQVGPYDATQPLILDPVVLVYCGYLGGSGEDKVTDLALDQAGHVYITGWTDSDENSFPLIAGPGAIYQGGDKDAFVAKLSADGRSLVYCGYIGGVGTDLADAIAVDDQGNAYIVGSTASPESSFPVMVGPDLTYNGGDYDVFLAKISASGTQLEYCGYLGGSDSDTGNGMAIDSAGRAHVVGRTASDETSFPVAVGPDLSHNGDRDAFVARLNAQGSAWEYCGFLGGSDHEYARGIAVDSSGAAYLAGTTWSSKAQGFPENRNTFHSGASDVFAAKVDPQGLSLEYCRYIGGENNDRGYRLALDDQGQAYLAGHTGSDETTFPVTVGPDLTYNGGLSDAYVVKLGADGTDLLYCGYLGGTSYENCYTVSVDACGRAHVAGHTASDEASFPVLHGPDLTYNGNTYRGIHYRGDAFIAQIRGDGTGLGYCGYLGGAGDEKVKGIATDPQGRVYVAGWTSSGAATFPLTEGPYLTYGGGSSDVFVAKVTPALSADTETIAASQGGLVRFNLHAGEGHALRTYLLLGGTSGTDPGIPLPGGLVTLPLNWNSFTEVVIRNLNSATYADFLGVLDGNGQAFAQWHLTGPIPAKHIGKTLHFAFCVGEPFDFVSQPVSITVVN